MSFNTRPRTLSSCHRVVIEVDNEGDRASLAVPVAMCKVQYLHVAVPGRRYGLGSSRSVTITYLVMCSYTHDYAAPGTEAKKKNTTRVPLSP